jgi:G protein-coupled receptor 107
MTAVVCLKMLSVFFEAFMYHDIASSGNHGDWATAMFYIFSLLKSVTFFAVIVLIGTGWSYMKPFLTERDRKLIYTVLVLQMLVNIAMIVVDESTPGYRYYLNWKDCLGMTAYESLTY